MEEKTSQENFILASLLEHLRKELFHIYRGGGGGTKRYWTLKHIQIITVLIIIQL